MVIKGLTFKRIRNMNRETLLKSIRKERFRLKKTLSMWNRTIIRNRSPETWTEWFRTRKKQKNKNYERRSTNQR